MSRIQHLRRAAEADIALARARAQSVDAIDRCMQALTALGYTPQIEDVHGLVVLRFDPDRNDGLGIAQPFPDDPPTAPAAPVAPPVAAPARPAVPPAAAGAVDTAAVSAAADNTGDPSDDQDRQRADVIRLSADGLGPTEIAQKTGIDLKRVHNLRYRYRERIDDLRKAGRPPAGAAPGKVTVGAAPAPPPAPPPAPVSGCAASPAASALTAAERAIQAHLNALGHVEPWTPALDLALVESLVHGDGAGGAAAATGQPKADCLARWRQLNIDPTSLDHQSRLLRVLRLRARQEKDQHHV